MKEEKCLVSIAMDKCQCEFCKLMRKMREFSLQNVIKIEAQKIYVDSLKEAGVLEDGEDKK